MQHLRRAIAMRTRPRTCRYDARFESGARAARPSFAAPDSRLPSVQAGLGRGCRGRFARQPRRSARAPEPKRIFSRYTGWRELLRSLMTPPRTLVVAMNSMSRPPPAKARPLRPLTLDRLRRPGMTAIAGLTCEPRAPGITASINVRSRSASSHHVTEPAVS
jgi:hypothetical protein